MLLKEAGLGFEIRIKEVEEIYPSTIRKEEVPIYLAELKAAALKENLAPEEVLITADTIVILEELILGKPKNKREAIETLRMLSGEKHTVVTGVCLTSTSKQKVFSCKTTVHFMDISEEDIEYYVEKYEPYDKAGSYAIQEWIGLVAIEKINGSYYNVLGLPVAQLLQELKDFGF